MPQMPRRNCILKLKLYLSNGKLCEWMDGWRSCRVYLHKSLRGLKLRLVHLAVGDMYACYVCYGYITAEAYTHTHSGRAARAGEVRCCAAALGALSCGAVRVAGQREVVRALLEADDAVDDVRQMCAASERTAAVTILSRWLHV